MRTLQILAVLILLLSISACDSDNGMDPIGAGASNSSDLELVKQTVGTYPVYTLSQEEIDGLLLMREEEKLARDVYLYFADAYSLRVFTNIARSETQHMSAIKVLLDKYGITDPITDDSRGAFADSHLGDLYAQLTAAGDASLLDALAVGATIEDLDIHDLMHLSESLDKEDILFVYGNLTKGSRNHLRAYYSQILANSGSYQPQFIAQDLFDSIVSSARERGRR
ncbi:MAG: DUF2202 domain-containing protein [Bacteroidota bacterium]